MNARDRVIRQADLCLVYAIVTTGFTGIYLLIVANSDPARLTVYVLTLAAAAVISAIAAITYGVKSIRGEKAINRKKGEQ